MGGWGAGLFLGISACRVSEEDTTCPFLPALTCWLGPGETGALTATCCEEEGGHFGDKIRFNKTNIWVNVFHKAATWHTISDFFFPLLNKLRNPEFFFFFGRSIECKKKLAMSQKTAQHIFYSQCA